MSQKSGRTADAGVAIRLESVDKSFPEGDRLRRILTDASLAIEPGEIVALLGRSGTGKSTLLNMLAGLDRADAGKVVVGGTDLQTLSDRERTRFRRRRLGFVFQSFNLVPTLTVAENVLLKVELEGGDADRRRTALERLGEVGLGDRADSWPEKLSGGEQQRVAVVAALAGEPEIVFADEPTGNLDVANAQEVTELLQRETRDQGRTLVLATHSEEVAAIADRRVTIADGRLEVVSTR